MKKSILNNGANVLIEKRPTKSVAIQVTVKAGSNNEKPAVSGISHFIEHMLFEGTKNRSARTIANEIEKRGGEFNAYTSNDRTAYHIIILKKYFDIALDIISDLIINPLFEENSIKKEKRVILDEIKLINDQPRFFQWILFSKALFKKHPARNPTYGALQTVKRMTKRDLLDYYGKHYTANNVTIAVVGDVKNPLPKLISKFSDLKTLGSKKEKIIKEPKNKLTKKIIIRKTLQSYVILGYKTMRRTHKDSYALDVIRAILGRGQSGTIFEEIRQKRGLAYEVGVLHEPFTDYGLFAVYLSTHKKNINNCISLILGEFKKLKSIGNNDLREAKDFLEGEFHLRNEDNGKMADHLTQWQMFGDAKLMNSYTKKIKGVTKNDIKRVAKKYLNKTYTLAVIKQK